MDEILFSDLARAQRAAYAGPGDYIFSFIKSSAPTRLAAAHARSLHDSALSFAATAIYLVKTCTAGRATRWRHAAPDPDQDERGRPTAAALDRSSPTSGARCRTARRHLGRAPGAGADRRALVRRADAAAANQSSATSRWRVTAADLPAVPPALSRAGLRQKSTSACRSSRVARRHGLRSALTSL